MRKFIVLPMAFLLAVFMITPAFAVSDDDWISPDLGFVEMESTSNRFTVYGTMTAYKLDENDMGLYDYTQDVTTGYDLPYGRYPVSSSSGVWNCNLPSISGYAPYNHYDSDQNTYYNLYEYSQYSLKGSTVIFYSDLYLDPGYYELKGSFAISQFIHFASSTNYFRPSLYSVGFQGSKTGDVQVSCMPTNCNVTFELQERSRLYLLATCDPVMQSYPVSSSGQSWPYLRYKLEVSNLQYRTIDPLEVTALEDANNDAENSLQQNDELETQWVGVMNDNFSSLNLSEFSWDLGLISAFTLVSDIFMRLWAAMGKYNILYVFPLTLAVVLLLIGRISKHAGQKSSGKGDSGD